jgi:hypothetical protein
MTEQDKQDQMVGKTLIAMVGSWTVGLLMGIGGCWFVQHIQFSWR